MSQVKTPLKPVSGIYLTTMDQPFLVEAVVLGHFGVHRSPGSDGFSVTHIGSGFSVAKGFAEIGQASLFANAMNRLKADWNFADPDVIKGWSKYRREQILKLIVEHGG